MQNRDHNGHLIDDDCIVLLVGPAFQQVRFWSEAMQMPVSLCSAAPLNGPGDVDSNQYAADIGTEGMKSAKNIPGKPASAYGD